MPNVERNFNIVNVLRTGLEYEFDRHIAFGIPHVKENTLQTHALLFSHMLCQGYSKPSFLALDVVADSNIGSLICINGAQFKINEITQMNAAEFSAAEKSAVFFDLSFDVIDHAVLNTLYGYLSAAVKEQGPNIMLNAESLEEIFDSSAELATVIHIIQKNIREGATEINLDQFNGHTMTRDEIIQLGEGDNRVQLELTEEAFVEMISKDNASICLGGTMIPFGTIQEARNLFICYRGDKGSSEMITNDGLIAIGDQKAAHFSYNGRLWCGGEIGAMNKKELKFVW